MNVQCTACNAEIKPDGQAAYAMQVHTTDQKPWNVVWACSQRCREKLEKVGWVMLPSKRITKTS